MTLRAGYEESTELIVELRNHVGKLIRGDREAEMDRFHT